MYFSSLLESLRGHLRTWIRNGRLTERGLARRTGLSQSHIHNVLHGVRCLTPQTADVILNALGLSVTDLMEMQPAAPAMHQAAAKKPPAPGRRSDMSPGPRKRSAAS